MKPEDLGRRTANFGRLRRNLRAKRRACCRCGQPIDYNLDYPDDGSFSVDHLKPLSTHPHLAEDPDNLDAAHLRCNKNAGNRGDRPGLGRPSREW